MGRLAAAALFAAATAASPPESVHKRGLVSTSLSSDRVLEHHGVCAAEGRKQFPRSTLGLISPWHPEGLDVAERFSAKFDYVSPLWFHIQPEKVHGSPTDWKIVVQPVGSPSKSYTEKLQQKGVKVVPTFAFYGWTQQTLSVFFLGKDSGNAQHQVVRQIAENCAQVECNGVHIEWGHMPINSFYSSLEPWLRRLRGTMRKRLGAGQQTLMLGVHPDPSLFGREQFEAMTPSVDFFVFHLYNFTGPALADGPAAPISWFEDMLKDWELIARKDVRDKVFAVLNFFGREYRLDTGASLEDIQHSGQTPLDEDGHPTRRDITGAEYVKILGMARSEPNRYQLTHHWEDGQAEHYVDYLGLAPEPDKETGRPVLERRRIYYPSLLSIQKRIEIAARGQALGLGVYNLGTGLDYFYELI